MKVHGENHRAASERKELARTIMFEGHRVTAVSWRGRWWWPAAQVGVAIGYGEGRYLVDKVRGEWSGEFEAGKDVQTLTGADLREFRGAIDSGDSSESFPAGRGGARSLVILSASGVDLALVLSRTDAGRKLRRILVDVIIPQLRDTGAATLPGAPAMTGPEMIAMVRELLAAEREAMHARIIADLRMVPVQNDSSILAFLDRRAKGLVNKPITAMAWDYAGPGSPASVMASHRGQIEHRVRSAVDWHFKWCFFPTHRVGELRAVLDAERAMADRVVAALMRERQLSLVPRPKTPPRGDA